MKLSEQLKAMRNSFEISNHTFVNRIAAGVVKKVANEVAIDTKLTRQNGGDAIKVKIDGIMTVQSSEEMTTLKSDVDLLIRSLKTDFDLIDLI